MRHFERRLLAGGEADNVAGAVQATHYGTTCTCCEWLTGHMAVVVQNSAVCMKFITMRRTGAVGAGVGRAPDLLY